MAQVAGGLEGSTMKVVVVGSGPANKDEQKTRNCSREKLPPRNIFAKQKSPGRSFEMAGTVIESHAKAIRSRSK